MTMMIFEEIIYNNSKLLKLEFSKFDMSEYKFFCTLFINYLSFKNKVTKFV